MIITKLTMGMMMGVSVEHNKEMFLLWGSCNKKAILDLKALRLKLQLTSLLLSLSSLFVVDAVYVIVVIVVVAIVYVCDNSTLRGPFYVNLYCQIASKIFKKNYTALQFTVTINWNYSKL